MITALLRRRSRLSHWARFFITNIIAISTIINTDTSDTITGIGPVIVAVMVDTITRSGIMVVTVDTITQSEIIMVTVALTIQSVITMVIVDPTIQSASSTATMSPGTRNATTTASINLL